MKKRLNKTCRIVEEKLLDYVEGKLAKDEIQVFEEHRKGCVQCDHLIKSFTEIWSSITEKGSVRPSDSFWPGLQAKIKAIENPKLVSNQIFAGLKMILRPAAWVMVLLAGIYFGYQMGNINQEFGVLSKSKVLDADLPGKVYVENYFQDFQEIPTGSPAEFYLQPEFHK